jgi:hypothetical protein
LDGLIDWAEALRVHLQDAGAGRRVGDRLTVADHDRASVGGRFGDKRNVPPSPGRKRRRSAHIGAHPFGAGTGLAETAPGQNEPVRPRSGRRQLRWPRKQPPMSFQELDLFRRLKAPGKTFSQVRRPSQDFDW